MNYFLENNKNYIDDIVYLEKVTGKSILNGLLKNNDEINFFSTISEIKFGKYIVDKFGENLKYEPNIFGKTPDWLVEINGDKIIFEVLRINPPNERLLEKIESYKQDKSNSDSCGVYIDLGCLNRNDLEKIIKKEEKYRELIETKDYKIIICIDASDWDKKIDVLDIKCSFDFENEKSPTYYGYFTKNVSGLVVKPYFGNTEFIINNNVQNKLNDRTLNILKNATN